MNLHTLLSEQVLLFFFFLSAVPLKTIDGPGQMHVVMLFLCVVIGIAFCLLDGSCLPAGG